MSLTIRRGVVSRVFAGLAVGGLAIAGSYIAVGNAPTFVAVPVHHVVVAVVPARVLAFSIVVLGELGDKIGFGIALVLAMSLYGGSYALARRVTSSGISLVVGVTAVVGVESVALTGGLLSALGASVAVGAGVALAELVDTKLPQPTVETRRRTLTLVGSALGLGGLSLLRPEAGRRSNTDRNLSDATGRASNASHTSSNATTSPGNDSNGPTGATTAHTTGSNSDLQRRLQTARDRSLNVDGLGGLVSSVESFYEVDVDSINPSVKPADWQLTITGSVGSEQSVTFDELTSFEPVYRFKTLRCVGEHLNGRLMDTALWTGVPLSKILEAVNPSGDYAVLHATDGYYEELPLAALREGMLAYGMNDSLLPRAHGRPVRALVPGHWGEINVKWLTKIEVREQSETGYWEKRGWHGTGPVSTVATLWTANHVNGGRTQVGGFAYAGTRGIDSVAVSTDGGDSWTNATLSDPLPDDDVWRQWEHTWQPAGARADVVVRAIDGTGSVQSKSDSGPYPNGSTGLVRKTIKTNENT